MVVRPLTFARTWLKTHAQVGAIDVWDPIRPKAQINTLQVEIRAHQQHVEKIFLASGRDGVSIWELGEDGKPPSTRPCWFKQEDGIDRQEALRRAEGMQGALGVVLREGPGGVGIRVRNEDFAAACHALHGGCSAVSLSLPY